MGKGNKHITGTLTTTAANLTVPENSGPIGIGIVAPVDSFYSSTQLTITVSSLPSDGTVLLSDGSTAVYAGETLTVAQLTGLEFVPTAGLFGQTSTFAYTVSDPPGTTASGTATLTIGPDTTPPSTTPASLTVAENAAATLIGIAAPTDPNYAASQLTIAVTALPSDGTVLLSDGTTAVTVGEALTVAQLTGLEFKPTAGLFGKNSSFTYSVVDPSGLTASGTATLAIGPDTTPPGTTSASLTVAANAAATPIGIAAPTDPNYAASQLTVAVTALPSDGTVLLSDGATAVTVGETLTVAQLTGLDFRPNSTAAGQSAVFAYTVTDPSNLSATGAATLSVATSSASGTASIAATSGVSPDGAALIMGDPGSLVTSDGTWSFGASSDYGDVILLNGVQAAGGSGTLLEVANQGNLYSENSVGQWYEWVAGGWNAASDPKPATTSLPLSPDGSVLLAGSGGNLVTTAGRWTFSTSTDAYGNLIMLNGSTAVGGSGVELAVAGGNLYQENNGGAWYEWIEGSGWNSSTDPTVGTGGAPPPTLSPDGSILLPGSGGSLVTSAGTWTFSTSTVAAGNLILLNGVQAAGGAGIELEVYNQGNLYADNAQAQWYEWVGGAWVTSADPTLTTTGGSSGMGSGTIYTIPALAQPSQTGDIVGVRLENSSSSGENSGYVTFGEVFKVGAVKPTDTLVARIGGVAYAVQMDVKTTNSDGSVRNAILTLNAPAIAAGGAVDVMLAKGNAAAPSPAAPSAAALAAGGYDVSVNFTFHNPDGTTTTDSASAAAALRAALAAGAVTNWMAGPNVNEFDVTTTVDGGKLKVTFDIRAYANGATTTDVIFDNGWMFSSGKTDLNYDVGISQGGSQVYSASGVPQYLYSTWHHLVSNGAVASPNVQYDVPYLAATGAVPAYDPSIGVDPNAIQKNLSGLTAANTGPLGTAEVTTNMPETGGRPDLGVEPAWSVEALMSQNAGAYQVMLANADAAGGIPWHFIDESTGKPINLQTYPTFWDDYRGTLVPTNGWPDVNPADPWIIDIAHMPDLNYLPYLLTGSPYQLAQIQAQADRALQTDPGYGVQYLIDGKYPAGFVLDGYNEIRAEAWDLREVAEAAYATPDNDPMKGYFTSELQSNMQALVQQYLVDGIDNKFGAIQGFIGRTPDGSGNIPPWEEGYMVTVLGEVAGMGMGQVSDQAVQLLKWMNNFISGLWTNGPNGYNPLEGSAYYLNVVDPTTGAPYTSWAQLYSANVAQATIPANPTALDNYPTDVEGGYPAIAAAALATEITWTGSPQAMQAYGYVVSQIANAFALGGGGEMAAYQASPIWTQMPRLPDGQYLTHAQMQIDNSANNVSLTAKGGDSLLSVTGGGTDTLTGGAGTTDLMYGGTGTDTFNAGTGNDYMFGGTGTNIFNDNTGNDYYSFAGSSNTLNVSAANSGHDTVFNFNSLTDKINIAANLNGNGITSTSQLLAGATMSNGNTVLHLGGANDITLLGVGTPSSLANSLFVK